MNTHDLRTVLCLGFAVSIMLLSGRLIAAPDELQFSNLADEDYFLDQVPVVLSATRLAQSQYEAPVAITVIDRTMIEASGAQDIPDVLRLVPGFQVAHAQSHTVSATYHGLSDEYANRMQVFVDGRSVFGAALGGVRWTDLPLDIRDVERIEVVRGPNAAAYGANSFLGAINIITQHPTQVAGTEVTALAGNKDVRKGLIRHGDRIGDVDYRATLGYRRDDGFEARTDLAPPKPASGEISAREPYNDGMRVSLFDLRSEYRISNSNTLEFLAGYNGGPRKEGKYVQVIPDDYFTAPRDRDVQSHFEQVRWTSVKSNDEELHVQFYHNYTKNHEVVTIPLPGFDAIDYSLTEERYELELQHNFRLNQNTRLVWGASSRLDKVSGLDWFNRDDGIDTRLQSLFTNVEWRPQEQTTVNLGTMVEYSSEVGTQVSPRAGLNYQLTPQHGLRVSASRAIRLPSTYEGYVDAGVRLADDTLIDQVYLGNPDLEPESMHSYEAGYFGHFPNQKLSLDIKVFHDQMDDRITQGKRYAYAPGDTSQYYVNSGTLSINGIEGSLILRPAKHTMFNFNYAYAKAKGTAINSFNNQTTLDPNLIEFEPLAEDVPQHTYSIFGMYRLPHQVDVSALYSSIGDMKWLGGGDRLYKQDRLDLRIAKHFQVKRTHNSIAVVVQNALDEYTEFRDANVYDTRTYVELIIGLP